jgi:signal transduction histidine kinase/CheY-like chemotaxis protein
MSWMFFSVVAAVCVAWSAVVVATRWAPPALGWYPQALIGASVLYMSGSMTYLLVDDRAVQLVMVWVVHVAVALSVFNCWWLLLRVMYMHGHDIGLKRRWTHGLPVTLITLTLVPALVINITSFVDLRASRDFVLNPLWFAFALVLLIVSACTLGLGIRHVWLAQSEAERKQYLAIISAMALPLLMGVVTAGELAPVHLMNIGYGFASAVLIFGVSRGWMDHGLGIPVGLLLESDPSPRLVINPAMRLTYRNPAALRLFPDALELGGNVLTWMPDQLTTAGGRSLSPRLLQRLVNGDIEAESTRPLLFRVGGNQKCWYALEARGLHEGARNSGCLLSLRDETTLERYREAALSARQVHNLRRLSSSIAHRFNNLMVSVVGNVDLVRYEIENESRDYGRVRGILEDMKLAGEQAAALAARFASVGGAGIDQRELLATTLDMNEQVRDALMLLEHQVPSHVSLDVALADESLIVACNAAEITDMVIDLVTNSLDAYGAEAGVIRISTGHRTVASDALPDLLNRDGIAEGDMAWLMVADHAGGMQISRDDGLFEPFVTTKAGRQGLGLSSILTVASAHRGGVDVRNVDGGANVVVYLPRHTGGAADTTAGITVEPIERETILLVDDDESVLQVHAAMLGSLGQRVFATTSPEEALQRAILHRFKAAVIDVYMPIMSGQVLAQRLRLRDPRLPVLFISGYVHEPLQFDPDDRFTAFLPKPFGMDALFVTLERICRPAQPERTGRVIAMPGVQLDR